MDCEGGLSDKVLDHVAVDVGETIVAALELQGRTKPLSCACGAVPERGRLDRGVLWPCELSAVAAEE